MILRTTRSTFAAGAVVLFLAAGAFVAGSDLLAQSEPSAEIVVGTYQPEQVAQAVGLQQKMMQDMQGLQARMQQAQQAGDQAAMQQIQAEAQQIQQNAADEFLADVEGVMAQVAEETGATIIATDVTYTAAGVATKDVTEDVIAALGVEAPSTDPAPGPSE